MRYYVEYVEKIGERYKNRRQGPWGEATARINANHIAKKWGNVDHVRLVSAEEAEKEFIITDGWDDEAVASVQDVTCPLRRRGLVRLEDAPSHGLSRWSQSPGVGRPIVTGDLSVESALDGYTAPATGRLIDERTDDLPLRREESEKRPNISALESQVDTEPEISEDVEEAKSARKVSKGKRKKR